MQVSVCTSPKESEISMTQIVKKSEDESMESIRKRLEKVNARKVPEFWKKMFNKKKKKDA